MKIKNVIIIVLGVLILPVGYIYALTIKTETTTNGDITANSGDVVIGSKSITADDLDEDGNYDSSTNIVVDGEIDVKDGSLDIGSSNSGDADISVSGDISVKDGSASVGNNEAKTDVSGDIHVLDTATIVDGKTGAVIDVGNMPPGGKYDGRTFERSATASRGTFYQKGVRTHGVTDYKGESGETWFKNGDVHDGIIKYNNAQHHWKKNGDTYGMHNIDGIIEYEGVDGVWNIVGEIIDDIGKGTRSYTGKDGEKFEASGEFGTKSFGGSFELDGEKYIQSGDRKEYKNSDGSVNSSDF